MNISELARSLNISRQMVYRLAKQGMPTECLEAAISWRKRMLHPFMTKTGRLNGNSGVKYERKKNKGMSYLDIVKMTDELDDHDFNITKKTLTHVVPVLWFSQMQRLGAALRDHNIKISAEELVKVQAILFLMYMIDIDKFLNSENTFAFPDTLMIRPNDEAYSSLIECLNKELKKEPMQVYEHSKN